MPSVQEPFISLNLSAPVRYYALPRDWCVSSQSELYGSHASAIASSTNISQPAPCVEPISRECIPPHGRGIGQSGTEKCVQDAQQLSRGFRPMRELTEHPECTLFLICGTCC